MRGYKGSELPAVTTSRDRCINHCNLIKPSILLNIELYMSINYFVQKNKKMQIEREREE